MAITTLIKAVQVDLTIKEIARAFAGMDDSEQAEFFSEVANYVEQFYKGPFCMQLQYVIENPKLTKEGKYIMETIGEYGK